MKFLLFISALILSALITKGQNIEVYDSNNKPIENVIIIGDNFTSHTNAQGIIVYFPEEGTTHIAFIHPSYKRLNLNWDQLAAHDFKVTLEERLRQLEEVTIRPSKRAQAMSDVPQKIIALTPQNTELYQPQTTADLLGNSSEVFIQKSQMGGGSPMVRGFSANRVLLVVDGVRLNNAIYRSGNLHNIISMDASSLEQTELILGPGSVIYGSDALGGVIHFYTHKPKLSTVEIKTPLNIKIRSASANFEKTAHINFNLAGKKWASVSSLTFSDYNSLTMGKRQHDNYTRNQYVETINGMDQIIENPNPNKQINSDYSQINVIQKVRFRPSELADFEYAFHFSKSSDIPRYDRLIQYSGNELKYAQWYYGPQQWMMHSLKGEFAPKNEIFNCLTIQAAYQDFTESRNDRKINKTKLSSRKENVDIYSLNIDADKYFSKSQSLFYGFEGLFNKVQSTGIEKNIIDETETAIASRYPNNSKWWSLAAYIMYNQILSSKAVLQAGARYNFSGMNGTFDKNYYDFPFDDFKNSDGSANVNFGMVFTPTNNIRFNMNAATGFRAPNIDDAAKVFDSEPGNVVVPNPSLQPEYASSFELGMNWNITENFMVDLTLFYSRLFNAMVRREGQLNGIDSIMYDGEMSKILMLTNTSWANIGGISSRFIYQPFSKFKIKGGIHWQAGSDSDGLPVRHVAPVFGDIHLILKDKKYQFDLYGIYNGEIAFKNLALDERSKTYIYDTDENGKPFSPAWYTLNIKGNYQFNEKINLGLGLENIFDVRYRPYSSGIVAPGINVIFSVGMKL